MTDMPRRAINLRSWIILFHRWMGVTFCMLFLVWFLSGFVLMYCPFPGVEKEDRLARSGALDPAAIHIAPMQAFAGLHSSTAPSQLILNLLDGRPVYRFQFDRRTRLVYADDGRQVDGISQRVALRVAAAWVSLPPGDAICQERLTYDDQWTLDPSVSRYGPFWKFAWPGGEEVYVSQTTGEVAQYTTRRSRLGAYFGAIPHWLYFTPLRRHERLWSPLVIGLSGAGVVLSLLGLVAGVWVYSPSKRYRRRDGLSAVPYSGTKRWHVFLGLTFGAVTCSWVFSGMLSMSPFGWLSGPENPDIGHALRAANIDLQLFSAKDPRQAIAEAGSQPRVRELELAVIAGAPVYLATGTPGQSRIVPLQGDPLNAFDPGWILSAVKRAAAPRSVIEVRLVNGYESYYLDRQKRLPLPALYVQLDGAGRTAYYLDCKTGRVVQSYDAHSRWNRWLYHGLHSLDFPWLYSRRPAWDILVIFLLLGGTSLSVTSLVIAWKLIRRKLSEALAHKALPVLPAD